MRNIRAMYSIYSVIITKATSAPVAGLEEYTSVTYINQILDGLMVPMPFWRPV